MKAAFTRRLEALEKRLLAPEGDRSAQETEFSRRLRERLEAGRRRVAARERRGLPPTAEAETCDAPTGSGTIIEILHAGRYRSALAHQALAAAPTRPMIL